MQYKDILNKYKITTVDFLNEHCTETTPHKTKTFSTIKEVYFNQKKSPYICIFLCDENKTKYVLDKYLQRLLLPNGMFVLIPKNLHTSAQINDSLHNISYNLYKEFLLHFYIKEKTGSVFYIIKRCIVYDEQTVTEISKTVTQRRRRRNNIQAVPNTTIPYDKWFEVWVEPYFMEGEMLDRNDPRDVRKVKIYLKELKKKQQEEQELLKIGELNERHEFDAIPQTDEQLRTIMKKTFGPVKEQHTYFVDKLSELFDHPVSSKPKPTSSDVTRRTSATRYSGKGTPTSSFDGTRKDGTRKDDSEYGQASTDEHVDLWKQGPPTKIEIFSAFVLLQNPNQKILFANVDIMHSRCEVIVNAADTVNLSTDQWGGVAGHI